MAEELGFDIVANDLASKEVENVTRALNGLENESEDVQAAFSKMEKELEDARREMARLDDEADDLRKSLQRTGGQTDSFSASLSKAKGLLGGLGLGLGAAEVAQFGAAAVRSARESTVLADALGVSAGEVQGLTLGLERIGGDFSDVRGFFSGLAVAVDELNQGTGPAVEGFRRLGITADQLNQRDIAGQFRLIQEAVAKSNIPMNEAVAILSTIYGEEDAIRIAQLGTDFDTVADDSVENAARVAEAWDRGMTALREDAINEIGKIVDYWDNIEPPSWLSELLGLGTGGGDTNFLTGEGFSRGGPREGSVVDGVSYDSYGNRIQTDRERWNASPDGNKTLLVLSRWERGLPLTDYQADWLNRVFAGATPAAEAGGVGASAYDPNFTPNLSLTDMTAEDLIQGSIDLALANFRRRR